MTAVPLRLTHKPKSQRGLCACDIGASNLWLVPTDSRFERQDLLAWRFGSATGAAIPIVVDNTVWSDKEFRRVRREFGNFPMYAMVGHHIAIQSAINYRRLRAKGITVRKIIDCWIATFCIERGFPLLHRDRDFDPFEKYLGLRTQF